MPAQGERTPPPEDANDARTEFLDQVERDLKAAIAAILEGIQECLRILRQRSRYLAGP